jgi:hypothetical protein
MGAVLPGNHHNHLRDTFGFSGIVYQEPNESGGNTKGSYGFS